MKTLKVYDAGLNFPITAEVRELLGAPLHHQYGSGLIVASSKEAAIRLIAELRAAGQPVLEPVPSQVRLVQGHQVDSLREAGQFNDPAVFITTRGLTGPVVRIDYQGVEIVGYFTPERDSAFKIVFEPTGTLRLTLTPQQAAAVRELLGRVDYRDARAAALRALLPAPLLYAPDGSL